jgi:hypothetical protein
MAVPVIRAFVSAAGGTVVCEWSDGVLLNHAGWGGGRVVERVSEMVLTAA